MTVGELCDRMGYREMLDWVAFDKGPSEREIDWSALKPEEVSRMFGIKRG